MKHVVCVYNPAAGSGLETATLKKLFARNNIRLTLQDIRQGLQSLPELNPDLVVAVGGDGTIRAVAEQAIALNRPLGILPAGTLNHFAKDLGLPLDPSEATEIILKERVQKVDYVTINEQICLNTSSLGIYPSAVLDRDRRASRFGKWPAAIVAYMSALFRNHTLHGEVVAGSKTWEGVSPLIFVGNNSYELEKVGFTARTSLTQGTMFVYVVQAKQSLALVRLAALSFVGMRAHKADFLVNTRGPVTIKLTKRNAKVAVDGEVLKLPTPLHYEMHHQGLMVCVP